MADTRQALSRLTDQELRDCARVMEDDARKAQRRAAAACSTCCGTWAWRCPVADVELLPCGECGMPCRPDEYHPFAACLMFKACHNSETVRANLEALRAEVELWRHKAATHKYRRERLAEALRDARRALAFAAQHLPECNEPYERANAALAQEDRNG